MAKTEIGNKFLWLVDLNTSETQSGESWALVGKQKDGGLSMSNNLVDVTTKDSGGFSEQVITQRSWSGTFSVNYDPFDASIDFLTRKQHDTGETDFRVKCMFREPSGMERVGFARVESMELTTPVDGAAEMSVSLAGDGGITLR